MKFEVYRDREGNIHFHGEVDRHDMMQLRLDPFDTAQLYSPCSNAADCLLDLELIFRRSQEHFAHKDHTHD